MHWGSQIQKHPHSGKEIDMADATCQVSWLPSNLNEATLLAPFITSGFILPFDISNQTCCRVRFAYATGDDQGRGRHDFNRGDLTGQMWLAFCNRQMRDLCIRMWDGSKPFTECTRPISVFKANAPIEKRVVVSKVSGPGHTQRTTAIPMWRDASSRNGQRSSAPPPG